MTAEEVSPGHTEPLEGADLLAAVEAVLAVADAPVDPALLGTVLGVGTERAESALRMLAAEYDGEHDGRRRGFEVRRTAGGWRLYSRAEHRDVVRAFVTQGTTTRLSQAALETLAVVAYRQPVTRAAIAAVRGVNVDGVMRTLSVRGLVAEAGTEEATGARLYVTTPTFLEVMGIEGVEDLPELAPHLPATCDNGPHEFS
ncbi:SMC-Scp complex subunit ScpB [Brevibacterium litoralis]|uniref:SMC-Scp complex subunit ScpB n=1 Tax=Brevibacterium litoralis TaxID=3138935 RepID=UPI0032EDFD14